jgi:hypothetical protein
MVGVAAKVFLTAQRSAMSATSFVFNKSGYKTSREFSLSYTLSCNVFNCIS